MDDFIVDVVPYFNDNYCYLIHDPESENTALIDCGDAKPVAHRLKEMGWKLTMVLATHFHFDHAGGIDDIKQIYPEAEVIKPAGEDRLAMPGTEVEDGQLIDFGNKKIKIISVPAHTQYCTSYYLDGCLFVGDTMFSAGCGRLFEGQASDLENAFAKLSAYPDNTKIYHGHEYTLSNLEFAKTIEPSNQSIIEYVEQVKEILNKGGYSTPTTLAREKNINPFLRVDQHSIIEVIDPTGKLSRTERLGIIRSKKDNF